MKCWITALLSLLLCLPISGQNYGKQWKWVNKAMEDDQPKTVILQSRRLFEMAEKKNNVPQMLRAYLVYMRYRSDLAPDSLDIDLQRLKDWEVRCTDAVDKAVLNYALAMNTSDWDEMYRYFCRAVGWDLPDQEQIVAALAARKTQKYLPLTHLEKGSERFEHDMLSFIRMMVLGNMPYSLKNRIAKDIYHRDELFYRQQGRTAAAAQVALEAWKAGYSSYPDFEAILQQYGHMPDLVVYHASTIYTYHHEKDALEQLRKVINQFPNHPQIDELKKMAEDCVRPQLSLGSLMRQMIPGEIQRVACRTFNVQQAELRWYRLPDMNHQSLAYLNSKNEELSRLKQRAELAVTQRIDLTDEPMAYRDSTLLLEAPSVPGYYLMEMVPVQTAEFPERWAHPELSMVSVTNLKELVVPIDTEHWEVWSMDRQTGHPKAGVGINVYTRVKNEYVLHHETATNENGHVLVDQMDRSAEIPKLKSYYLQFHQGNDYSWVTETQHFSSEPDVTVSKNIEARIFTDRALYRPGQIVQFSVTAYSQDGDETYPTDHTILRVELRKPRSYTPVDTITVTTDEMGVATGSVTIPADAITGVYSLRIQHDAVCTFRVEEYKRPTFEVTWMPIEGEYAWGDTIAVSGRAMTYSGVPVPMAQVLLKRSYREMWWWRMDGQEELGRDTLTTDESGYFIYRLALVPPTSRHHSEMGLFHRFILNATVTSPSGESHDMQRTVSVSSHRFHLSMDLDRKMCKENLSKWKVNLLNTMGEDLYQRVKLSVFAKGNQEVLWTDSISACQEMTLDALSTLPSGNYMATVQYDTLSVHYPFLLFSLSDTHPVEETSLWMYQTDDSMRVGQSLGLQFGTSMNDAFVMVNVFNRQKRVAFQNVVLNNEVRCLELPCREEWGDAVRVVMTLIKNNKVFQESAYFQLAQPDKRLNVEWTSFRDYLLPGEKETWNLKITKDGKPMKANLMATMYDASLDAIAPHHWNFGLHFPRSSTQFQPFNNQGSFNYRVIFPNLSVYTWDEPVYDHWEDGLFWGYRIYSNYLSDDRVLYSRAAMKGGPIDGMAVPSMMVEEAMPVSSVEVEDEAAVSEDITPVEMRSNFEETAFFYPMLRSDDNGELKVQFTLPESLTRWRMMGLAHSEAMDYTLVSNQVTARKLMMVQPQLPRFIRVGDETKLTATVQNLTDSKMNGTLTLELTDSTLNSVVMRKILPFQVAANGSQTLSFTYIVKDLGPSVVCRFYAKSGQYTDGEQHLLPVLSDLVWLTESRAIYLNSEKDKVDLSGMMHGGDWWNNTSSMIVESIHNPIWVAVESLKVLEEPGTQNAVDIASAYYAASIAQGLKSRYPALEGLDALSIDAQQGSKWLKQLQELQGDDGGFSWFKGMQSSTYITRMVVEPFIRLHALGVPYLDEAQYQPVIAKALAFLDQEAIESYQVMQRWEKEYKEKMIPGENILHYMYINTLLPHSLGTEGKKAWNYFLDRLPLGLNSSSLYDKALACVVFAKSGQKTQAKKILQSLLEYTLYSDELGRYYDTQRSMVSWRNYRIPVQTLLMEVLSVMQKDQVKVDPEQPAMATDQVRRELCQWLLNQRRTQLWDNSSVIMDVLYALLLAPESELTIRNAESLHTTSVISAKLSPKMPKEWVLNRDVTNSDSPMSWVSISMKTHLPMEEVHHDAAHSGLKIERSYYMESIIDGEKRFVPVDEQHLQVGQKVRCRIQLSADRDFDFVEIHAQRAACMEPVRQLSGYEWHTGIGAYHMVKDTESLFYVDRLAKGKYELSEDFYITHEGVYQAGLTTVQGTYCPEFSDHTGALRVQVTAKTGK